MVTVNTKLDELFDYVIGTLKYVEPGEIFLVKDLFRGFEWNRIPKSYRTKLGSMVFAYAKGENGSGSLQPLDKTPQNQQKYMKL